MKEKLIEIRKRHEKRIDGNAAIAYGIAKGEGLDAEGMTPKQVWEELAKLGYSAKEAKVALSEVSSNRGFWSIQSELEDDLSDAGFEVLESNSEYIVVSDNNSDSDTQYKINLHGTENSIVFGDDDIEPIRMPDDDDIDFWDEDISWDKDSEDDFEKKVDVIRAKYKENSDSVFAPGELDHKSGVDIENPIRKEDE